MREVTVNDNPSSVEKFTSPSIYKGYMLDIIFTLWQHLNIFYCLNLPLHGTFHSIKSNVSFKVGDGVL